MGQKTNSYLKKLSFNKLWKSDVNTFNYTNSNLENLFIYFLIKNNLKKNKAKIVKFKIYNTGEKIKLFLTIFFQKKVIKRRLKWWERKKRAERRFKFRNKKTSVKKRKRIRFRKLLNLANSGTLMNKAVSNQMLSRFNLKYKFQSKTSYWQNIKKPVKKNRRKKFKNFKNIFKLLKFRIKLENEIYNYIKKPVELTIQNVMWKLGRTYIKTINNILKKLHKAKKYRNLRDFIKVFLIAILCRNAQFLSEYISNEFVQVRKPGYFFQVLKWIFKEIYTQFGKNFEGLNVTIWGKIGKARRAQKKTIKIGNFGLTNFNSQSNEYLAPCFTRYGVYGIRTLLTYASKKTTEI